MMELLKILKCLVFIVSFVMFCYQVHTATINLIHPPTVDSTYARNISIDDLPLLTVCPINQTDIDRLFELEFLSYNSFLAGYTYCNVTKQCHSWGANVNLTFDEVNCQVFDLDEHKRMGISGGVYKDDLVFIPRYGMCKETSYVNITQKLKLTNRRPVEARVLITDRNHRSYIMPDMSSHIGSKILWREQQSIILMSAFKRGTFVRMTRNQ